MSPGQERIEKAFISFRIGTKQWLDQKCFDEMLELFEKHKGVTDQITMFTSYTHVPIILDTMRQRCERS